MRLSRHQVALSAAALLASFGGLADTGPHPSVIRSFSSSEPGLILAVDQGERRVRRASGGAPFIIKVDARNGGSPALVMGYEVLPPGYAIPPHHHPDADEILFIQYGHGVAQLGGRQAPVGPGGTVYIPRGVRISLHVTGPDSLGLAFFFSHPGFEQCLRDMSVVEGQPVVPPSEQELKAIRERCRMHAVYETP
jgi:quercetin dioxygenase-like cupin family protein